MTTFYRDPDILVTSGGIRMNGHVLRPEQLLRVWHTRGRRSWRTVAGRGALLLTIGVPILVGALGIAVAVLSGASGSRTVLLAGGGLLAGLLTVPVADHVLDRVDRSYDRGSRTREIWGRTADGDVLLLRTADAARFGRIYRALQRALEPAPGRIGSDR